MFGPWDVAKIMFGSLLHSFCENHDCVASSKTKGQTTGEGKVCPFVFEEVAQSWFSQNDHRGRESQPILIILESKDGVAYRSFGFLFVGTGTGH